MPNLDLENSPKLEQLKLLSINQVPPQWQVSTEGINSWRQNSYCFMGVKICGGGKVDKTPLCQKPFPWGEENRKTEEHWIMKMIYSI